MIARKSAEVKALMKPRTPTDFVILGTLIPGERHGYEIMRFLESALEGAWRVSTSQLYVLLKRMEQEGLVVSRSEAQDIRPSKRVFHVTPLGRDAFEAWVNRPVPHVRDLRMEFICKLFFFRHLSLPGAMKLVLAQIDAIEALQERIRKHPKGEKDAFLNLLYGFKARNIECLLRWLKEEAATFADKYSS
ncbi:MAG: hypothetical protein COZ70_15180 [Deltaproteobacteria bacterium CG_4_8_14_3_um_filter_51_11]|nr:PadR family transcriptional regulator [bacterium]OIP38697.1 MAG: hypothetical protein AUK25_12175 [Desulfobacteraceae bacterium CG2_30_51_40]PIP48414.1 MAG: hypothetical protein COX16_01090 [Deltaproteobacteria bacterium CG23_combo_of_CG06-09_8_20_14_all_51_20]PIX18246.1 MAG: hypothetical protein COZ70_15180 [Deltaproteobacteria bacterium CG_4_8_14_3_um_filter_51_11]PJB37048.1 MAG: hypothetical protein CO107_06000 [Deltaproteobacteria bacterium CG_4_9_14_3_um_filter_51_14]